MSANRNKKSLFAGTSTRGPGGGSIAVSKAGKRSVAPSNDSTTRLRNKTIYGGGSRTILSSSSRKNVQLGPGSEKMGGSFRPPVQVFDDLGVDVTPVPLLQLDPNVVRKNQSNILADSSAGTPTDLMSQASIYQTGTVTASTFGGGPFTRSVFSASQSGRSTGSITDEMEPQSNQLTTDWADIRTKQQDVKEELTEDDLEKEVAINLTETDTIWLLDIPSVCVSTEAEEAKEVAEQNDRYQELTKSRVGNDRYADREMNTFNEAPKCKAAQTNKIGNIDVGVNATTWDMYDAYKAVEELAAKVAKEKEEAEEEAGISSRPGSKGGLKPDQPAGETASGTAVGGKPVTTVASMGTMSSIGGTDSVHTEADGGPPTAADSDNNEEKIMNSESLLKHLVVLERAVNLNTYQPKQALYRGFEIVEDIDKIKDEDDAPSRPVNAHIGPNLDRLWAYTCPLTVGHNVSCLAWNKINPDLLAVGYGQFDFTHQKSGSVCCWSIKNPEYPERVYTCPAGVTAVDFSLTHPNLLAVGLYDGTVAIYNVRRRNNETILDSALDLNVDNCDYNEASGKHTGPVWQLKWIEKERGSGEDRVEVLVSISQDGRVTQWSIRKGFESYDLMKLKRVSSKSSGKTKKGGEAFISRYAGGLCFDFSVKDLSIYLAGTEDGFIHRCSCSYNEQYLDSYQGHTGPVYSIAWSPFIPDIFLSCSGDWTIKLWHQDKTTPVLSFHSATKTVPNVAWSPYSSTVFACVNERNVEIWDLSQSTLDPIIVGSDVGGNKLSTVTFAKNSKCVLVGDSGGQVSVYELKGMPGSHVDQVEALNKVIKSSLASQLKSK